MDNNKIAEVLPLNINLNHGFFYKIPLPLKEIVKIGYRVIITFRKRKRIGIVLNIVRETEIQNLKEIEEVLDPIPILSQNVLTLADWMVSYYLYPRGTIISQIIPTCISCKNNSAFLNNISLEKRYFNQKNPHPVQKRVLNCPEEENYQYNLFANQFPSEADVFTKPVLFNYRTYKERDLYYNALIRKTMQEGKQVLILIPDQFSCNNLKKKLSKIWGKSIAIFDKKASQSQKYLRFIMVQQDQIKIVIGTRSNIFLPFLKLGLIIVEQEDSNLYKEERVPHYHAREVAIARGRLESARVILGSGAPSVESYWQGMNKKFFLLSKSFVYNTKRKSTKQNRYLQTIFVNLEEGKSFQKIISFPLQQKIAECLKAKKGVVLFLNRRGFARYISCIQCGQVMKCPDCHSLLSYHKEGKLSFLVCYKCKKRIPYNEYCPKCNQKTLKPMGFGTQYVEDIIRRMFPKAVIQRFDRDIAPNIKMQQFLLNKFKAGEINIFIGTQLLLGKLDYKQVGLLSFILIDHLLNMPDYHAAETTLQLIYQIVLNLYEQKTSKVLLIQTCHPEHHSLQAIKELSYPSFYQKEIALREELAYPPFTKIIRIDFVGTSEKLIRQCVCDFYNYISSSDIGNTIGKEIFINDSDPFLIQEKSQNRVRLLVRVKNEKQKLEQFKKILLSYILKYQNNKVKLMIDVEPIKLY